MKVEKEYLVTDRSEKAANPFDFEYKRLNANEQRQAQKGFCEHYKVSPGAFRNRLCGFTAYSETELIYLKKLVKAYFV